MNDPMRCFACNRKLVRPEEVFTSDTLDNGTQQYTVSVGPECFKHVESAGASGYQPPLGGPRLYLMADDARRAARAATATVDANEGTQS